MTTTSAAHDSHSNEIIDITIFPVPSGSVAGVANVRVMLRGKPYTLAKATLLVDAAPDVSIKWPAKVALADCLRLTQALSNFGKRLLETDGHGSI